MNVWKPLLVAGLVFLATGPLPCAEPPWPTVAWPESTPEAQGLDPELLAQADRFIRTNCPSRYSLLVIRNGYLVFERYYNGRHRYSVEHIQSASKSWISALIGILVGEGRVGLDEKLDALFPECFQPYTDPRKREIRLRHLLSMTAGFQWDDFAPEMTAMIRSRNWFQSAIDAPLVNSPGEKFNYNTALTHLLSGIVTRRSGLSTYEFAARHLFAPMGINYVGWNRDAQGYYIGGWQMHMTAQDLARFGYLFLRKGVWEGRPLVPAEWVLESSSMKVDNRAAELRSSRNNVSNVGDYGYLWWIKRFSGRHAPFASGYGGQMVFFIPELDMVVATTGDPEVPYLQSLVIHDRAVEAIADYVVKAVRTVRPAIGPDGVVQSASGRQPAAADSFVTIYGRDFAAAAADWEGLIGDDGNLPIELGGVRVRAAGRDCFVSYVSPSQLNALLPADLPTGELEIEVSNGQGSATAPLRVDGVAPAFFTWQDSAGVLYPAALFAADGVAVAPEGAIGGSLSRPAKPGDVLHVYASGLGPTSPRPSGFRPTVPSPLAESSSVRFAISGVTVAVTAVDLVDAGQYRLIIEVPEGVTQGLHLVSLEVAGKLAQTGVVLAVGTR